MNIAKKPRILFISRAYPPVTGGIENQNYELSVWLPKLTETKTIANTRGKKFLPVFLPYCAIKSLFLLKNYDAILLGDGVLTIIGWFLKLFYKKPTICIVHGLDLTFKNNLYQKLWVNFFVKKMEKLIAVGNETKRVAIEKGIAPEKIVFIPNGVDADKFYKPTDKKELEKILNLNISEKKIILTSGRLAKRKGVAWFCENVMPKLPENIVYVVAGDGPDRENIEKAIIKNNLSDRVKMLGFVSNDSRNILFNTCDIFIQPNIKIPGDMEGFGISVIEAASCELPVVASKLEGLKDAIKDNQNGFLIEPYDSQEYAEKISALLADDIYRKQFGKKARKFVIENYSWEKISKKYLEEIGNSLF